MGCKGLTYRGVVAVPVVCGRGGSQTLVVNLLVAVGVDVVGSHAGDFGLVLCVHGHDCVSVWC